MRELLKSELIKLGYSPAEVEADINAMSDAEVEQMCKEMNIYAHHTTAKVTSEPRQTQKPTQKRNPNPPEYVSPRKKEFDPVAEAMNIVSEAKRQESKPPIKYVVTPCYKLTICSDVDVETMNAVKAELKARGGKWSPELEGFVFDTDPENLL